MDLIDRIITLAVGGFLGYVLARIVDYLREIKEEVDEIYEIECHKGEQGITRLRTVVMDAVLIGVVLMVAYAAWTSNAATNAVENDVERDKKALCLSLAEARDIDRDLVDAVYQLAITAIERPAGSPELSELELVRINLYIDRVNEFRRDQYAKIQPSKICEPFVDDEGRLPPTPDQPHIKP